MRYFAPLVVFLLLSAAAVSEPATAQPNRARQGVQSGEVQSLDQILNGIRRERPGSLADVEGPNFGPSGEPHYRLKWLTPDGRVLWLDTDARTAGCWVPGDDRGRPGAAPGAQAREVHKGKLLLAATSPAARRLRFRRPGAIRPPRAERPAVVPRPSRISHPQQPTLQTPPQFRRGAPRRPYRRGPPHPTTARPPPPQGFDRGPPPQQRFDRGPPPPQQQFDRGQKRNRGSFDRGAPPRRALVSEVDSFEEAAR